MKKCVINALKFVTFDFFKEYFLNLVSLKSAPGALVNKTQQYNILNIEIEFFLFIFFGFPY